MLRRGVLLRWSKDGEFFPGTVFDYNTATGKEAVTAPEP